MAAAELAARYDALFLHVAERLPWAVLRPERVLDADAAALARCGAEIDAFLARPGAAGGERGEHAEAALAAHRRAVTVSAGDGSVALAAEMVASRQEGLARPGARLLHACLSGPASLDELDDAATARLAADLVWLAGRTPASTPGWNRVRPEREHAVQSAVLGLGSGGAKLWALVLELAPEQLRSELERRAAVYWGPLRSLG